MRSRLSLFYAAVFATIGIQLPFWPVWLQSRGLNATEIGVVLAVSALARVVASPMSAHYVDHAHGRRGRTIVFLVAVSLVLSSLLLVTDGFWSLLVVNALLAGMFASVIPLGDNLTMLTSYRNKLDYGRIRLWGSLGFLLTAVASGRVLVNTPPMIILWAIMGGLSLSLVAATLLPEPPVLMTTPLPPRLFRSLFKQHLYWRFFISTGFIQASHGMYYGFSTLHWRSAGLQSDVIGGLWAEAVIAEVVLFAYSDAVVARLGPGRLLVIGAVGATVRWFVLGMSTSLPVLAVVQLLHALSFGAAHLGAMHFIARAASPGAGARVQALYSSVTMGASLGLALLVSGSLYQWLGGSAFFVSTGMAAVGTFIAYSLMRRWNGGEIRL